MAHLSKVTDNHRLRYRITFPDRSYVDRSRRYKTRRDAKAQWPKAAELEERTKHGTYNHRHIEQWRRQGFLNATDTQRLGFNPEFKSLILALEEYRASWEVSPKEATSREGRLNRIASILGGELPLKNLRYADGLRLKKELKALGYKTATIQKCIQDLKRCFNLQLANQTIEFNPFATLKGGRISQKEKIRHVTLTDEQVGEVMARAEGSPALGGWLKVFLLVFFGCGIRRGEALNARWENVDWDERSLLLTKTKTGIHRKVALGQRLYYELLVRKKEKGLIFPSFHPDTVSKTIKRHLQKCGIKMRLHDTRHTYTTLFQGIEGVKPIDAMARTGHKDMRMLSLYTHGKFGKIFEDEFSFMKVNEGQESEA